MNHKKNKRKSNRRARKHQDRAWAAVEEDNLDLAHKEFRHALREGQDNPSIWNDYGLVLALREELHEAEAALRNAILLAPTYAEAHANLARLLARSGRTIQAERLQRRAVELEPWNQNLQQHLTVYQRLLPEDASARTQERDEQDFGEADNARMDRFDWGQVGESLKLEGHGLLPSLLTEVECRLLRESFHDDALFEKTVLLTGASGENGSYRFFRKPIPDPVRTLRAAVYSRVVPAVNSWQKLLGRDEWFPRFHMGFLARCAKHGQSRTTPLLLHYKAPAVNHLHRDISGAITFPVQLAVTLSARPSGVGTGGCFVLEDVGAGRRGQRWEIEAEIGDGVLFCTRERLVRVAGMVALQPVLHGMTPLTIGERYVLGLPFHEYKDPGW